MAGSGTQVQENNTPTLIRKSAAATMLDCSVRTLDRLIERQGWKTIQLNNKSIRLKKSDVENFIISQLGD